jgi:hypothetical protein
MDISCTQIQTNEFLAAGMSCSQLLEQVMSQNNNTWPQNEEISNYILNAPLGGFTSLLTAPDTFQVKKCIVQLEKCNELSYHVHRIHSQTNFMQNNMIITTSRTSEDYDASAYYNSTLTSDGAFFDTNEQRSFDEVQIKKDEHITLMQRI